MADVMVKLNWDYATIVHSDDLYGHQSLDALKSELLSHSICIQETISMKLSAVDKGTTASTKGIVYIGTTGIGNNCSPLRITPQPAQSTNQYRSISKSK